MKNETNELERLSITDIKNVERASQICHKVGIISAFLSGFSFLASIVFAIICETRNVADSTIGEIVEYVLFFVFAGLGFASCKFSCRALKESSDINEFLKKEKINNNSKEEILNIKK